MAFRGLRSTVKKMQRIKSEFILNKLRGKNVSNLVNDYTKILRGYDNIDSIETRELVMFPTRSFNILPTNVLRNLIQESYDIIKEKGVSNNVQLYNTMMINYIRNGISFDINSLLNDMNKYNIRFNNKTYQIVIEHYCNEGAMENVEHLLKKMKSENESLNQFSVEKIIVGFIKIGLDDKARQFIKENNLDENDVNVIVALGKGYAAAGNIENVKDIFKKIENKAIELPHIYILYYRLLAMANVPLSELEWMFPLILNLLTEDKYGKIISDNVFHLNRIGLYNVSLGLIEYFKDQFTETSVVSNLLVSFNSLDCPIKVYKYALVLLLDHAAIQKNLFYTMEYDEAYKLANDIINVSNGQSILTSLLSRAMTEKSHTLIDRSLDFGLNRLEITRFNGVIQFFLIPSMVECGMVKNPKEILQTQTKYVKQLLRPILMHTISEGLFDEYNSIRDDFPDNSNMFYSTNQRRIAIRIMENLSFAEIDKVIFEIQKCFAPVVVNKLLANIVIEKIISSSKTKNIQGIDEAVKLGKKFKVAYKNNDIERLKTEAPNYIELYDVIFKNIFDLKEKPVINEEEEHRM